MTDLPADDAEPQLTGDWQRLDKRMLFIHPVHEIARFLPAIVAILIAGSAGGQNWFGVVAAVIACMVGVVRWWNTRYRIDADHVQLRHGLVNLRIASARTDRVRSVDVTAPLLHRLLGLARVEIGTGAAEAELRLDGLSTQDAAALRARLLHQGRDADQRTIRFDTGTDPVDDSTNQPQPQADTPDTVLYRLQPQWIGFAPFGPAGLAAAAIIVAAAVNFLRDWNLVDLEGDAATRVSDTFRQLGLVVGVTVAVVALLVAVSLLAVGGYLLAFAGFTLSRDAAARSLQVRRGLLTSRATSLELARLRGVEVHRPVPLRWVGGARLTAIATGVKQDRELATVLAPPSPLSVIDRTAGRVLDDPAVLGVALRRHGPAATRRRHVRAEILPALLAIAACVVAVRCSYWLLWVVAVALLVVGVALGHSRARWLGHAVTDRFLIVRTGSLRLRTDVVQREGAVGVVVRRTFFQRRAGLATVAVATAAGRHEYPVPDLPVDQVLPLAETLLPREVLAQFVLRE